MEQEGTPGSAQAPANGTIPPKAAIAPRPATKRRRRRTWFGWLGFPSRKDAAQHVRMIGRHFLSLTGFRP